MNVVSVDRPQFLYSLLVGIVLWLDIGCAVAGPCSAEIAELDNALRPPAPRSAPDSKQLPPPAKSAEATYDAALARARLLDAAGDRDCKKALTEVKMLLGM